MSPRPVLLLVLSFTITACSSPPEQGDRYEAEPFASTVLLDQDTLGLLRASEADGTLRFSGTPAALAALAAGQVLVAGRSAKAPTGLLRFVGEVAQDSQGLVLKTTEAPIQLAFRKLEVAFSRHVGDEARPLTFEHVGSKEMALTKTISGGYWPALDVDEYVFDGDGDPSTPLDQVHVTGKLSGGIDYSFTLGVDWGAVENLPSAVTECAKKLFKGSFSCSLMSLMPEAKVGFMVAPGASAELGLEGVAFLGYEREITVAEAELPEVPIGPLLFFPKVQVLAKISGEASSQFKLSTQASVSAETSISFSSKSGGSLTPPKITKSFSAPAVEASLGARATLRIGPRLIVALYDIAGIYASLYAVAEVDADQSKSPCWSLQGGVDGDAGFLIKSPDLPLLGSVTLASFGKDFGLVKAEIASGSCKIPAPAGPGPTGGEPDLAAFTSPTFTPWAAVYPDIVDGFPYEGPGAQIEWAQVTPTIDGRFMLSGSDARALVKLDADGKVVWARRYVADVPFWKDLLVPDLLPGRVVSTGDGAMFVIAHPYTVLKVGAAGGLFWARHLETTYRETWLRLTDAAADGSGGLYVVGTYGASYTSPLDDLDGWLLRLDPGGKVLWSVRFGAADWAEVPRRLVRLPDGVVVVGQMYSDSGARWRGMAARFRDDGSLAWGREIVADDCGGGYEQRIYPTAALRSSDGDLILGAGIQHSGYELAALKLKPDGALSWYQTSGATDASHLGPVLTDLVELPTSGYLAAGFYSGQQTHEDIWLAGLDAVGKVQWARRYGGLQNTANPLLVDDNYPALQLTRDGGVIVGAYSDSLVGEDSMWAMKVAAKDGTITFNGATSAQGAPLDLQAGKTCLAASAWTPPAASLSASAKSLTVQVKALALTGTTLAP